MCCTALCCCCFVWWESALKEVEDAWRCCKLSKSHHCSNGTWHLSGDFKAQSRVVSTRFFSQKHRRCLGSRLGDYGRSDIDGQDPVDGRWTSCGRAGAAEIAWEEARDGGARAKGMIWWTGGGRAVDGLELQK